MYIEELSLRPNTHTQPVTHSKYTNVAPISPLNALSGNNIPFPNGLLQIPTPIIVPDTHKLPVSPILTFPNNNSHIWLYASCSHIVVSLRLLRGKTEDPRIRDDLMLVKPLRFGTSCVYGIIVVIGMNDKIDERRNWRSLAVKWW